MKKNIIIVNTYGLISIYEVLDNANNKLVNVLKASEDKINLDDVIETISNLVNNNLIKFLFESEHELDKKDFSEEYAVIYYLKY